MHTTLIAPEQLRAELASAAIVDCRSDLLRPEAGREAYIAGHIPGAVHANLDTDLSGPKSPGTGRHPLPNPTALAIKFGQWGISSTTQVIAYDADNGMYASRLWWLLRWLGHRAVAVLDGGYRAWVGAGLPIDTEIPANRSATFVPRPDNSMFVTTAEFTQRIASKDWRVLDARAPERFRGDVEPIDPVAGHVPGARNHPFAKNMGTDGHLLAAAELRRSMSAALDSVPSDRAIMMCGSGVTACHNLLALEVAGLSGAKLYAGSWSEWIRDAARPVEKGEGVRG